MSIRQILQRRDEIRVELKQLMEVPELSAEQRTRCDVLEKEAGTLNDQERRQALIDEMDRRAAGTPLDGSPDGSFDKLSASVTVLDTIRAQMGGTDAGSGRAREVSRELERRSGRRAEGLFYNMSAAQQRQRPEEKRVFTTAQPSPGGGYSIAYEVGSLIDRLRERTVVRQLGATVLGGLVGNLTLPRLAASATAHWVAENSAITVSDPTMDGPALTPRHCGGLVELSRQLLQQSSLDVAAMVEMDLARILAVALDRVALVGGGSGEPKGLLESSSGITRTPLAANITWPDIIDTIAAVDAANGLFGALGWVGNAQTTSFMRQTLKTTSDSASNMMMNDPNSLAGYPYVSTQNVPSNFATSSVSGMSAMIFGNWNDLVIGFWSELDVLVSPFAYGAFEKGNVQVRAMLSADLTTRHPLSFAALTNIVTS